MPSVSKKQHNLMAAVAKNPAFAKKVGIKQSVGQDFLTADKGKTFKRGGMNAVPSSGIPSSSKYLSHQSSSGSMKGGGIVNKLFKGKETYKEELNEAKAVKSGKITPKQYAMGEESEKPMKKMAKGGAVKYTSSAKTNGSNRRGENTKIQKKGLTEGRVIVMKGSSI